jgi:hypothetical protein
MTSHRRLPIGTARLLWVAVIALVAAGITTWLRTESLPLVVGFGLASAVISVGIVWLVDRIRESR